MVAEYSRFEKKILNRLVAGNAIINILPLRFLLTLFVCSSTLSYYFLLVSGFFRYNKWIIPAILLMLVINFFLYAWHVYLEPGLIAKQAKKLCDNDQ